MLGIPDISGAQLRQAREAKGLSLLALAHGSGVDVGTLDLVETGRHPITDAIYRQLWRPLGLPEPALERWPELASDRRPHAVQLTEARCRLVQAARRVGYALRHGKLARLEQANQDVAFWTKRLQALQAKQGEDSGSGLIG